MTRLARETETPQRRWGGSSGSRPSPAFLVLVGVITVVTLVPLGYVVSIGMQVGWATLAPLIFRPSRDTHSRSARMSSSEPASIT